MVPHRFPISRRPSTAYEARRREILRGHRGSNASLGRNLHRARQVGTIVGAALRLALFVALIAAAVAYLLRG